MPNTMRGPGIFMAQFTGDAAPFNSLRAIAGWAVLEWVRHQVGGTGRARGRAVHPRSYDRGNEQGVRRLRCLCHRRLCQPPHAGPGLKR